MVENMAREAGQKETQWMVVLLNDDGSEQADPLGPYTHEYAMGVSEGIEHAKPGTSVTVRPQE